MVLFTALTIDGCARCCNQTGRKIQLVCHTNVTVILLQQRLLILTLVPDRECRRSPFPEGIQRRFSRLNSVSHSGKRLSNCHCRGVIVLAGSPTPICASGAAMPQRCSIFFARTISTRST